MKQQLPRPLTLLVILLLLGSAKAESSDCVRCRLADELKQLIVGQITEHGLTLDPEADGLLNELVDQAARELERSHFSDSDVSRAKTSAKKLGDEIAAQASLAQASSQTEVAIQTSEARLVTKQHIFAALKKLCPLYPFC